VGPEGGFGGETANLPGAPASGGAGAGGGKGGNGGRGGRGGTGGRGGDGASGGLGGVGAGGTIIMRTSTFATSAGGSVNVEGGSSPLRDDGWIVLGDSVAGDLHPAPLTGNVRNITSASITESSEFAAGEQPL